MTWPRRSRLLTGGTLLLTLLTLLLGACSAGAGRSVEGSSDASTSPEPTASPTLSGTVTVLAAASLSTPFTTLARSLEQAHPGVQVKLSFGSSTTLARQVAEGALADVYASAGTDALKELPAESRSRPTDTIATNTLAIAVPRENPGAVAGLSSLADPSLRVVLCAQSVPCGKAADAVLARAGVEAHVVSREPDVKAALAKVTLGEADAAIVYVSDVTTAGAAVRGVDIPAADNTVLSYPLVRLTSTPAATAFSDLVASPEGVRVLTAAGFTAP